MKEAIFGVAIISYLVLSALAFLFGACGANTRYSGCLVHNRIEKVFPAYELGCYLFKEIDHD